MMNVGKLQLGSARSDLIENLIRDLATEKPKQFSHEDLISFTSNFCTRIGFGGFGNVYKGHFPNGVEIAVKVLIEKDVVEEMFMAEVSTMGRTYHRNLVKLYGFCFEEKIKALVYEYMKTGALDDVLFENYFGIKWEKFYGIAVETAKGLAYLHDGCYDKIIHHDIKAGNVLLDSNLTPKIADFGLAKLMSRNVSHLTMTRIRGTAGYAAPETFTPSSEITSKCDVYSFGMMLFEILRMKKNGQGKEWFPKQAWEKFNKGQINEIIEECSIIEENRNKAKILCMVALWCIQFTPQTRPSMGTVVTILEREIQVNSPPNPFLSSDFLSSMQPSQEIIYSQVSSSINESLHEEEEGTQEEEEEEEEDEDEEEEEEEEEEEGTQALEYNNNEENDLEQNNEEGDPEQANEETGSGPSTLKLHEPEENNDTIETGYESDFASQKSRSSKRKEANSILRLFEKKYHSGSEQYVVIYTATKGLWKWVRESNEVRTIFKSYENQIGIIERDSAKNSDYNDDLRKLCGKIDKPVVFVNGRLIGGANEVKKLDENGKLKILFDGLSCY